MIKKLKVKLFADGADKAGILEMYANPLISGFTTNPTLMKAAGVKDYKLFQSKVKSHKVVFTHNDFYYKNILYDGKKFWIIDWEYSGFNPNILDLANLSRNIGLNKNEENFILEEYFGASITSKLRKAFQAIKIISILNEVMW